MSRQWRSDDTEKWTYGFGNGSDGDLTISSNTTETVIDSSCSGTAGSTSLSATNASFAVGQFIIIHQTRGTGVGQWELAKIAAYTAGTITTDKNLQLTYTDSGASQAQVRVLKQHNNVTINSGVTYTAKAWDGNVGGLIGWFAKGKTTVNGTITTLGRGFRASTEYKNQNGPVETDKGEGSGTDTFGTTEGRTANGNGGGGGGSAGSDGGIYGSGGASGGSKTAGSDGYNDGYSTALGGSAVWGSYGSTVTLGGGAGGRVSADAGDAGSEGTNGSGLLFVFAKNIIVTGSITLNSTNGDLTGDSSTYSAGAGGAGSAMFWGETIALGTSLITANGGQAKGSSKFGGNGGIVARYSTSFTGTTSPTTDSVQDLSLRKLRGGAAALVGFLAT